MFCPIIWRHSQVVRQRSAKPLFPSSNLGVASREEASDKLKFQQFEAFFMCVYLLHIQLNISNYIEFYIFFAIYSR